MRKEMKKAVSMVLATAMVLTMGNATVLNKKAAAADDVQDAATVSTCAATLLYADNDWGNYTLSSEYIVDGDGEYTVTATREAEEETAKVGIFDVDLVGIKDKVASFGAIKVSDVKVKADGRDVEVDQSKLQCGDLEKNGNYRINIFNMYSNTEDNSPIDVNDFFWEKELSVTFSLEGTGWGEKKEVNPYYGFLAFQDSAWNYRNGAADLKSTVYKYLSQAMIGGAAMDLSITNAVMDKKEKASYSVKIDGLNDALADTVSMNYVFLGTDIPATFEDVKFTNVKYIVDGTTVKELEDGSSIIDVDQNTAGVDCYRLSLCNTWNDAEAFNDPDVISAVPMKSMEIQYTIENMPYTVANADKEAYEAAVKDSETTTPTDTPAPTDNGSTETPVPTVAPTQAPAVPTQSPVAPTKAPTKKTATNACTKVKAKKAKVSLKKGKKATLKFTVTAKTKSKKTTDKLKVTVKNKKIVTVSKKSLKKGSASVTIKAKKKGSTTVTAKIGKKSAKVKVTVK